MISCKVVTKLLCLTVVRRPIVDCELVRMGNKQKLQHHKLFLSGEFFFLSIYDHFCCRESAFAFMSENENVVDRYEKKERKERRKSIKIGKTNSLNCCFIKRIFSRFPPSFRLARAAFSSLNRTIINLCSHQRPAAEQGIS